MRSQPTVEHERALLCEEVLGGYALSTWGSRVWSSPGWMCAVHVRQPCVKKSWVDVCCPHEAAVSRTKASDPREVGKVFPWWARLRRTTKSSCALSVNVASVLAMSTLASVCLTPPRYCTEGLMPAFLCLWMCLSPSPLCPRQVNLLNLLRCKAT